jgi:alpha-galactosidase
MFNAITGVTGALAAIVKPSTPIMGFSTWNTFGQSISESILKDVANKMVSLGLRDLGYTYLNIDDGWGMDQRNASGCIVGDPHKFPHGMKAMGDYVHSLNMSYGLYTARNTRTCGGKMPGSLGNEDIDARTFADFGADFVKNDDCGVVYADAFKDYGVMQEAIAKVPRPMIHNVKAPDLPANESVQVSQFRRVGKDLKNSWENLVRVLDTGTGSHIFFAICYLLPICYMIPPSFSFGHRYQLLQHCGCRQRILQRL